MRVVLKEIPVGKSGKVAECDGGVNFRLRLNKLGLHKGDVIKIKRNSRFSGPVIIEAMGREIAVGRGIAEKIFMEIEE
ncbi:MAG: ferrous iron transport protein A [Calditrichia bacterium]|nr:ferrous iron transport protein A [Calditrichia bacterium]